ncbi:hypothetical protein KC349_g67 [Hortaea werneckii]|nr:hypothetical protein KC349_g67 [Hortaea werneckii]
MLVSIKAQRPKTALRFDGSSLAKLIIQTHQNASSRSTFVTAASSPGARLSSLVIVCGVCALLLIGGNILSDGKLSVVGALSASSSAKPDERKSAQDGVSTRLHSSVRASTGSSNSENSRKTWSLSRYSKCLARLSSANGPGDTESTSITTPLGAISVSSQSRSWMDLPRAIEIEGLAHHPARRDNLRPPSPFILPCAATAESRSKKSKMMLLRASEPAPIGHVTTPPGIRLQHHLIILQSTTGSARRSSCCRPAPRY